MKRIAVIGLGNIATRHRRNLRALFPEAEIYAVSASGRKIEGIVSDSNYISDDLQKLSQIVDMAIIASPATSHLEHAIPFIKVGVPTLIEKPVFASLDDAEVISKLIEGNKTPICIGYCLRYLPSTIKLHELLEKNTVGKVLNARITIGQYLPDWRPTKNYKNSVSASKVLGGGALLELSHEIDYSRFLFGELTIKHAIIRNSGILDIDVEDIADIVAISSDEAVIHIHLDFIQRQAFRECEVVGSEGRLSWDLINNKIVLHNSEGSEILYNDPKYDKNEMYMSMLKDFIRFTEGKPNTCIKLEDGIKTLQLVENIRRLAD
ncbi:Gfo/Idh/MocA family protein [Cedecea neteri]|uniref:Gfo/Idh/MocA family oxidoreductase n=1 Tax=Cedecea neteri TaxID=158822 RepID=A0A291DVW1_9ENTR|nr:Gfo/Idh/MocA family oxidoreductase [Cedecea neteri]ATF91960.1 gfo/Idh/MocA family oxidoreductase [Cedecea neteri]